MKTRKIAIVGSRAVGKSSLAIQFVEGHFTDSYYPTIESTYSKAIRVKGQDFSTEIVDTAGQDEYSIFSSNHALGIHGYVLVYSIVSRQSFDMLRIIRDKLLNYTGTSSVPMVLVGNKLDLSDRQRQVTLDDVRLLANEWGCAFVESSAKNNQNISRIFELAIIEVEKISNPESQQKSCMVM